MYISWVQGPLLQLNHKHFKEPGTYKDVKIHIETSSKLLMTYSVQKTRCHSKQKYAIPKMVFPIEWVFFICSPHYIAIQCTQLSEQNKSEQRICTERKTSGTYHLPLNKHLQQMKPWYHHHCYVMITAAKHFTCEHAQCYLGLATQKQRDGSTTCLMIGSEKNQKPKSDIHPSSHLVTEKKKSPIHPLRDNGLDARGNNLSSP